MKATHQLPILRTIPFLLIVVVCGEPAHARVTSARESAIDTEQGPGREGTLVRVSSVATADAAVEFKTLPDEVITNIGVFPVTGIVSWGVDEVLVNDLPIDLVSSGFTEPVELQTGENEIRLTVIDGDGATETWTKRVIFDPNFSARDRELLYVNTSYHVTATDVNEHGVVVIDTQGRSFLGLMRNATVRGIRRDGSEIVRAGGQRCSTDSHTVTDTLPSYSSGSSLVFSHDNQFVYYSDKEVDLESNQITRTFADAHWPRDIDRNDTFVLHSNGYLELGTGRFTPVTYSCGGQKILDPTGDYVLTSCYAWACGHLEILQRVDGNDVYDYSVGCPTGDYAWDIVLSPDGKTAYAGFYGNPVTGGGVILIIDIDSLEVVGSVRKYGGGALCVSETGHLYASASDRYIEEFILTPAFARTVTYVLPSIGKYWDIEDIFCKRAPRTVYVDDDGLADCRAIQAAIDMSWDGDMIVVEPGVYIGEGNRDIDFKGKAVVVRSTDPNDPNVVASTIVDCSGDEGDYHRGFHFRNGERTDSVLAGITITNGGDLHWHQGGAVRCENSSPTITHCVFLGNAGTRGGAVYCAQDGPAAISDCTFVGNIAGYGGALYLAGEGPATVSDCRFNRNSATEDGGAVHNRGRDALFARCRFTANTAADSGGAIYAYDATTTLRDCLMAGNAACDPTSGSGGALWLNSWGSADLVNCTLADNSAGHCGGAICYSREGANPDSVLRLLNCILWANDASDGATIFDDASSSTVVQHSNVEAGYPGDGNLDVDPLFVSAGCWAHATDPSVRLEPCDPEAVWFDGDYRLRPGSPSIDAGDPNYLPDAHESDVRGWPRFADAAVDMGAYEFEETVPVYRFWSSNTGRHFYTSDEAERDYLLGEYAATWAFEGIAYHAYAHDYGPDLDPVYRLWSPARSAHRWTISEKKKDDLIGQSPDAWQLETVAFYVYPQGRQPVGSIPVYRFWSGALGSHFYTASESERDLLIDHNSDTWTYEEIAWYAELPP